MPSDRILFLATMNEHKFTEAKTVLAQFEVKVRRLSSPKIEIQSSDLEEISTFAANNISRIHKGIVVVEDSGLFVRALGGFPGPFSAYVHRTIGADGILRLMVSGKRRDAYFQASIAASESGHTLGVFTGMVSGRISWKEKGKNGFGFDSIFVPEGMAMTFGEMDQDRKNQHSHRSVGFRKLASWFVSSRQSRLASVATNRVLK